MAARWQREMLSMAVGRKRVDVCDWGVSTWRARAAVRQGDSDDLEWKYSARRSPRRMSDREVDVGGLVARESESSSETGR